MARATGLIGGARRIAAQRGLTPEEQAAQQSRPRSSTAGMGNTLAMASARPLFGGQMMQAQPMPQMQQPQPQQQPKRPSMWDGIAEDPLAFFFTGPNGVMKRQEADAAQQATQAQEQQLRQWAQSKKLDPEAVIYANRNNPEEFGKQVASAFGSEELTAGNMWRSGIGGENMTAPAKTGGEIRQVGNSIVAQQQDGSWKPVYTAESPQEAARAFSMFIDKNTGRQMFLMSDGKTKDTGIEAYIPTQITSVGGVPTAVDKRTLETSALAPLGDVADNKAALASAEVQGQAQGKAAFDLPSIELRTQTAISSIDELKKLNLDSRYGAQGKLWAVPGTEGANIQARITQVTSQAFLNAFDQLRGAGAITETEGNAATAAITRLKDQNITVGEALQAMSDLQSYYTKGLAVARQKARMAPTLPNRQAPGAAQSDLSQYSTEDLQRMLAGGQ